MLFTPSHEWIVVNEDSAVVGITQYASSELGEIVYVELPKVGTAFQFGEEVAVLESTKAAADIYAPVSGVIQEVNEELGAQPGMINASPEGKGWLFKMKLSDPAEMKYLLNQEQYQQLIL